MIGRPAPRALAIVAAAGCVLATARPVWAEDLPPAPVSFARALAYDLGAGTEQSTPRAFAWYRVAAEQGMPEAQLNVGVMLDSGRGVAPDSARAATWYARAAAHGVARAAFNLGMMYQAGDGVPRNPALAAAWLQVAAPTVPAAKVRLASLSPAPGAPLGAATPVWPVSHVMAGTGTVELVWTAPGGAATYFVEVRSIADGQSREAFSGFTRTSSIATVPATAGRYAWRVSAVGADARYAASAWTRFEVSAGDVPE